MYKGRYPSLVTVITGGDGIEFDYLLKNSIFAAPDFLLTGLACSLPFNATFSNNSVLPVKSVAFTSTNMSLI